MTTRSFPLADILSVTTDRLLSRRCMAGLGDLLNWMTGDQLEAWQFLRAADECRPVLIEQYPFLEALQPAATLSLPGLLAWLGDAERVHGEELGVARLDRWDHQDPLEEFLDQVELRRL
jgi:hypothetical protein